MKGFLFLGLFVLLIPFAGEAKAQQYQTVYQTITEHPVETVPLDSISYTSGGMVWRYQSHHQLPATLERPQVVRKLIRIPIRTGIRATGPVRRLLFGRRGRFSSGCVGGACAQ